MSDPFVTTRSSRVAGRVVIHRPRCGYMLRRDVAVVEATPREVAKALLPDNRRTRICSACLRELL